MNTQFLFDLTGGFYDKDLKELGTRCNFQHLLKTINTYIKIYGEELYVEKSSINKDSLYKLVLLGYKCSFFDRFVVISALFYATRRFLWVLKEN